MYEAEYKRAVGTVQDKAEGMVGNEYMEDHGVNDELEYESYYFNEIDQ